MGIVCRGGFARSEQPRVCRKYYPGPNYAQEDTIMENNKTQQRNKSKIEILTSPTKAGSHHPAITSPSHGWSSQSPPNRCSPWKLKASENARDTDQIQTKVVPIHEGPSPLRKKEDFSRREDKLQSTVRHPANFSRSRKHIENHILPASTEP